jgi:ubiquitin-protein ligase
LQNQWSPIYDVSAILTSIQVGDEAAAATMSAAAVIVSLALAAAAAAEAAVLAVLAGMKNSGCIASVRMHV